MIHSNTLKRQNARRNRRDTAISYLEAENPIGFCGIYFHVDGTGTAAHIVHQEWKKDWLWRKDPRTLGQGAERQNYKFVPSGIARGGKH